MTCLIYLAAAVFILAGTSATPTELPPPTTTLAEDSTDTPTPASSSNSTKENGTNRILNYGAVAGSSFGVFEDNLHAPIHPYLPPHPPIPHPFLPAPGHILPGRPPFPPHNGILPSTGSCKYYCPGRYHNQLYCCDDTPSHHGFQCPQVRDKCPGTHYARHLRFCSQDRSCAYGELCCLDACVNRHVCKAPERR